MAARVLGESALRVSDCVTELLRKQPFFGSLVLRLPLRPDPTRETLATDGHEIRYSPQWVANTDAHLIGYRSVTGWELRRMKTGVLNEPGLSGAFATSVAAMTRSITL